MVDFSAPKLIQNNSQMAEFEKKYDSNNDQIEKPKIPTKVDKVVEIKFPNNKKIEISK